MLTCNQNSEFRKAISLTESTEKKMFIQIVVPTQAYQLWQDGKWNELLDPALGGDVPVTEVMKCLQVALLCVQDSADDRPNMSEVVAMLGSLITMPEPRQPAYYNVRISSLAVSSDSFGESSCGISNITLTDHEEGR